jgi:hypothetical protein
MVRYTFTIAILIITMVHQANLYKTTYKQKKPEVPIVVWLPNGRYTIRLLYEQIIQILTGKYNCEIIFGDSSSA